jgi:hypothetical protein
MVDRAASVYQDEVRDKTAQLLHHLGSDWMLKSDYKRIRHLSLRLAAIFAREGTLRSFFALRRCLPSSAVGIHTPDWTPDSLAARH